MSPLQTSNFTSPTRPHRHFSYIHNTTTSTSAPLLIFIHGWPATALTWRPQLLTFSALNFRVAAIDTLGYGHSTASQTDSDYSCEELALDQLEFLAHLGAKKAVWVMHDWGCGIGWTLAAHNPEVCVGVVGLSVPYRMLECGLEKLLGTVNRGIYDMEEYPNGPWDYQVFYERWGHEGATRQLDGIVEKAVRLVWAKGNPASVSFRLFGC